jgi:hypothetical protein
LDLEVLDRGDKVAVVAVADKVVGMEKKLVLLTLRHTIL